MKDKQTKTDTQTDKRRERNSDRHYIPGVIRVHLCKAGQEMVFLKVFET